MRWWIAVAVGGCFSPSPLAGQPCTTWCPPPERCVAGACVASEGSGSDTPVDANYMFVTSTTRLPVDIHGPVGGDAWCNELATAAQLPGQYIAWLSTLDVDANNRLLEKDARGWYRVDGKPFTDRVEDLTNGVVYYPPRITEQGMDLGKTEDTLVGTGTFAYGSGGYLGADCVGWTTGNSEMVTGVLDGGATWWTEVAWNTPCATPIHIYCFGIDKKIPVPPPAPPPGSRLAFVAPAPLGGGTAGLDSACQSAAQASGVAGTFVAWLSTTGSAATSRMSGTKPWRRKDNVLVLTPELEMLAPIDQALDGSMPMHVWTGAPRPDLISASPSASCNDWTSTAAMPGVAGNPHRSSLSHAFGEAMDNCSTSNHVYCLER